MSSLAAAAEADQNAYNDFIRLLQNGIFGDASRGKFTCLREQVQMACLVSLVFATGCRAGDFIAAGREKPFDHLRWRDVIFFLDKPTNAGEAPYLSAEITYRRSDCTAFVTNRW